MRGAAFLFLAGVAGCAQQMQGNPGAAAVAPQLSVERFLQASNARDYEAMARLFGTPDGPIADTGGTLGCGLKKLGSWLPGVRRCVRHDEVELRMAVISDILRHQDYRIVSDRREPGRRYPTSRIGVDITRGGAVFREVPFMVVRTRDGRWLVQEIELQRITGS